MSGFNVFLTHVFAVLELKHSLRRHSANFRICLFDIKIAKHTFHQSDVKEQKKDPCAK